MSQAFGLALEGHFEEAYQIHDTIVHLHRDLFIESSPSLSNMPYTKWAKLAQAFVYLWFGWLNTITKPLIIHSKSRVDLV